MQPTTKNKQFGILTILGIIILVSALLISIGILSQIQSSLYWGEQSNLMADIGYLVFCAIVEVLGLGLIIIDTIKRR